MKRRVRKDTHLPISEMRTDEKNSSALRPFGIDRSDLRRVATFLAIEFEFDILLELLARCFWKLCQLAEHAAEIFERPACDHFTFKFTLLGICDFEILMSDATQSTGETIRESTE
jgi:hypothetical protein